MTESTRERGFHEFAISVSVGLGPCSIRDSQAQGQQRARWVIHRPASTAPGRCSISTHGHTLPPVHTQKRRGQPIQAAHTIDNDPWGTRQERTSQVPYASVKRHACWHDRPPGPQEHGSAGAGRSGRRGTRDSQQRDQLPLGLGVPLDVPLRHVGAHALAVKRFVRANTASVRDCLQSGNMLPC